MKNKKAQNMSVRWYLIMVGIIITLGVVIMLIGKPTESFTIYKTECKNESWIWHQRITIITDNLDYEEELKEEFLKVKLEKNIPNATLNVDSIKTFLIENDSFQITGNIDYLSSEEICEQKEVNETIINYEIQITCEISAKYCDNYIPYPVVITANGSNIEDISMEGCKGNCRKEVISTAVQVKDLTRKWLDENFECICPEGYGQLVEDYGNGTRKTLGTCNFVDIEKHKNDMILCSKWKMGDYTVVKQ